MMVAVKTWAAGVSGNWNDAALWNGGLPVAGQNAYIQAPGTYTVTVSDAEAAAQLTMNAPGATLNETAAGSLNISGNTFVYQGALALNGTNNFGGVIDVKTAVLSSASAASLQGASIELEFGAKWTATKTQTITNAVQIAGNSTIAAAHGTTLTVDSSSWIMSDLSYTLNFGSGAHNGHVIWSGVGNQSIPDPHVYDVHVRGGTLSGDGIGLLLGNDGHTIVDAGGKIDFAGDDVLMNGLEGGGTVLNSGTSTETLTLGGGDFSGKLSGQMNVAIERTVILTGTNANTDGNVILVSGGVLQLGNGGIGGSINGPITGDGDVTFDHNNNFRVDQSITVSGELFFIGDHTATVHRAESAAGGVGVENGTLSIDRASAIGTSELHIFHGGALRGTKNMTLDNTLQIEGQTSLQAAHGTTLTLNSSDLTFDAGDGEKVVFNDATHDGTVVVEGANVAVSDSSATIEVARGVLKDGGGMNLFLILENHGIAIDHGATLAAGSHSENLLALSGGGNITTSGSATIRIDHGTFGGVISGSGSVYASFFSSVGAVTFTGANTYTGGTKIDPFNSLTLGGEDGSVKKAIEDNGKLLINHTNTFALVNAVSGTGQLIQYGPGLTTVHRGETYNGGTAIEGGTLSIDRAAAIGTGDLTIDGGKFLATKTMTVANALSVQGNGTIAAAHGQTLTFDSTSLGSNNEKITFGDSGHDGTVNWHEGLITPFTFNVEVADGTLRAANSNFGSLTDYSTVFRIDSGGILNLAAQTVQVGNLQGSGEITGSDGSGIDIQRGAFSGAINGDLSVTIDHSVTLSGGGNFTGGVSIQNGATLHLSNAAGEDIKMAGSSRLVLNSPGQFSGEIHGFKAHDEINLRNIAFANATKSYDTSTHILTVKDGTHTDHLHFGGSYLSGNFKVVADNAGGVDIVFHALSETPPHHIDADLLMG